MNDQDTPEMNPYETPREVEPLTDGRIAKSRIEMTTIAILTPIAGFVAGWIGHAAKMIYLEAVGPRKPAISENVLTCLVFIPPTITVIGMIIWAVRAQIRESAEEKIRWAEEQAAKKARAGRGT